MNISLSGSDWQIKGYWPYIPIFRNSVETGLEMDGVTEWIPAQVPGSIHNDLYKNNVIEDPYFEKNSLKCEWVENRWWIYKKEFNVDKIHIGKRIVLIFKGVDYKCHVYLNGRQMAVHEGMYEPIEIDLSNDIKFDLSNVLEVVLENAPEEMSQIGYTSRVKTQKSRFNYKWDFSTRLVHLGIWDDVYLRITSDVKINDYYITTDYCENKGVFNVNVDTETYVHNPEEYTLKVYILNGQEEAGYAFRSFKHGKSFDDIEIYVEYPKLWWPNGIGNQFLYRVVIEICNEGQVFDRVERQIGIRKLEYTLNENSPENALPYTLKINGKKVYIKGVNLTPLDMMYGAVEESRYKKMVCFIKAANVNMVRIWGGGVIEKDIFYQLCDENGILVWQEFIQSSSGIDNFPSVDANYLELLRSNSYAAIKGRRNYTCLAYWSGGNELRDEDNIHPAGYGNKNIAMLKSLVEQLDPKRMFLPTSASGPNEFLNNNEPGSNHDVHGSWKYEGIKGHYDLYNKSDSLFHSEFGVDGCSSIQSMEKIFSKDNLKIFNSTNNLIWRHHGDWWDTLKRDEELFGKFQTLEQYTNASQYIQAEGVRYILEANRRRKYRNSGSIIWQMNEPWPNAYCTSIIEYSGLPKMVYYWMRKAYAPTHISLQYEKLNYTPTEAFRAKVFLHNSLERKKCKVIWEIRDIRGNIIMQKKIDLETAPDSSTEIDRIDRELGELEKEVFFVKLTVFNEDKGIAENIYMFSQKENSIFSTLMEVQQKNISVCKMDNGYSVKNSGDYAALFVHGRPHLYEASYIIENNYTTLFPGEEKFFEIIKVNESETSVEGAFISGNKDLNIIWNTLLYRLDYDNEG